MDILIDGVLSTLDSIISIFRLIVLSLIDAVDVVAAFSYFNENIYDYLAWLPSGFIGAITVCLIVGVLRGIFGGNG